MSVMWCGSSCNRFLMWFMEQCKASKCSTSYFSLFSSSTETSQSSLLIWSSTVYLLWPKIYSWGSSCSLNINIFPCLVQHFLSGHMYGRVIKFSQAKQHMNIVCESWVVKPEEPVPLPLVFLQFVSHFINVVTDFFHECFETPWLVLLHSTGCSSCHWFLVYLCFL